MEVRCHQQTRTSSTPQPLLQAAARISTLRIIIDDAPAPSVEHVCTTARALHARYGLALLVVDSLDFPKDAHPTESKAADACAALRNLAALLHVPAVVCVWSGARVNIADPSANYLYLKQRGILGDSLIFLDRDEVYNLDANRNVIDAVLFDTKSRALRRLKFPFNGSGRSFV